MQPGKGQIAIGLPTGERQDPQPRFPGPAGCPPRTGIQPKPACHTPATSRGSWRRCTSRSPARPTGRASRTRRAPWRTFTERCAPHLTPPCARGLILDTPACATWRIEEAPTGGSRLLDLLA